MGVRRVAGEVLHGFDNLVLVGEDGGKQEEEEERERVGALRRSHDRF